MRDWWRLIIDSLEFMGTWFPNRTISMPVNFQKCFFLLCVTFGSISNLPLREKVSQPGKREFFLRGFGKIWTSFLTLTQYFQASGHFLVIQEYDGFANRLRTPHHQVTVLVDIGLNLAFHFARFFWVDIPLRLPCAWSSSTSMLLETSRFWNDNMNEKDCWSFMEGLANTRNRHFLRKAIGYIISFRFKRNQPKSRTAGARRKTWEPLMWS